MKGERQTMLDHHKQLQKSKVVNIHVLNPKDVLIEL